MNATAHADFMELYNRAGSFFTPAAPIDQRNLFKGRVEELASIIDAVNTKGQHAAVFGERGVGKTSLVSVLGPILTAMSKAGPGPLLVRQNCTVTSTYGQLWHRAFRDITFVTAKSNIGFTAGDTKTLASLAASVPDDPSPEDVIALLRPLGPGRVFVFDEFDRIEDRKVTRAFADTIKALSDYGAGTTVIIVGVGDDVQSLLEAHGSIERALVEIRMPRMQAPEMAGIIEQASSGLTMTFADSVKNRIVRFSQGLPHYVHLLGLHATRVALKRHSLEVTSVDLEGGMKGAVEKAPESMLRAYQNAVDSPRKDALFKHVLVACALARTDDMNSFAPIDVRKSLKEIGRPLEIPAFASHLNKFASPDRGNILQKLGKSRRFRYRFKNPLLQPYVLLRGIADGLIPQALVDQLDASSKKPKHKQGS